MYTLAFYYMLNTPLEENPLLYRFVNGDDAYRNSRFKLIPYISKGNTEEGLLEVLGTCRINHLDASKSVQESVLKCITDETLEYDLRNAGLGMLGWDVWKCDC